MARRCGCAGSVCSCFVEGTGNATVTGSGSDVDPYVVDVDAAVLQVSDTATANLTLTGAGTPASPYVLSADVIGGGGGLSTEQIMDYLGSVTTPAEGIKGGTNITITYNDAAGTITVANTTNPLLRSNHTGEVGLASMASDWMSAGDPTSGQGGRIPVWDGNSWEHSSTWDVARFATKDAAGGGLNGSVRQFADWSDTAAADGLVPQYDTGVYVPTDLSTQFAQKDSSTGRLIESQLPLHQPPIQVLDLGENPDPSVSLPSIILRRQSSGVSLVPTLLDEGFVNNSAGAVQQIVLTLAEVLAVGDEFGIAVGMSNEAGLDHINVVFGGGAAANVTAVPISQPNTSAAVQQWVCTVTTQFDAGDTITISARDVANAAINRVHILAAAYRMPGILANTSAKDREAIGGGASTGVMTSIGVTAASAMTASDEVGIGLAMWNDGTGATTRTLAGTNGWAAISNQESEKADATSSRSLAVLYKTYTAIETPALTTLLTASDGQTGQWAVDLATYKAA